MYKKISGERVNTQEENTEEQYTEKENNLIGKDTRK